MKRTLIGTLVLFSFLFLFCRMADCAEDNKKTQSLQSTQQTSPKPILPLTVSSPLPGVSPSPALLPNIPTQVIAPKTAVIVQNSNTDAQLRNSKNSAAALPKMPNLPILLPSANGVAGSVPSVPVLSQKIQLIKSVLGTVIKIGSEKDAILWLDIKDRFSGKTVRITVDSEKTRVIKENIPQTTLKDIKIGDIIRVIFNQASKDTPVNVISIISKEDLKTSTSPE